MIKIKKNKKNFSIAGKQDADKAIGGRTSDQK